MKAIQAKLWDGALAFTYPCDTPFTVSRLGHDAAQRLYRMIGCYSEAILACGYNDDEILAMLLDGSLDSAANPDAGLRRFNDEMRGFLRKDGQYAEQLKEAIAEAGGWTDGRTDDNGELIVMPLEDALAMYGIAQGGAA